MALLGARKPVRSSNASGHAVPAPVVTVIVPAYNEERNIEAKIRTLLAGDYPRALLDIIVVSDASTDRTDEIVRGFEQDGVRLLVQARRSGKTAGLNRAVSVARGDVIVFTDANAVFPAGTIDALVDYFRDPLVGLVTGYTRYTMTGTGEIAEATNLYTRLERLIKKGETSSGCCVGADGAVFAMRRALYRTLRDDDINDLVLPLGVIDQGYRCVLAEDAFCCEHPGKNVESEFRRQSRITNRTLRAIWRNSHLLNPFRFPVFAFFLISHKIVRFLVPLCLLVSTAALLWLALGTSEYPLARAAAVIAGIAVALSIPRRVPLAGVLRFLNVFLSINLAVLHGWWKFLSGRNDVVWQHDRSAA
jgi:cellulose synthase/poly-beta-1,6-N-acetylglucosamine synthase-like glycosyltransferase